MRGKGESHLGFHEIPVYLVRRTRISEASGPGQTTGFLQHDPLIIDEIKDFKDQLTFQRWSQLDSTSFPFTFNRGKELRPRNKNLFCLIRMTDTRDVTLIRGRTCQFLQKCKLAYIVNLTISSPPLR